MQKRTPGQILARVAELKKETLRNTEGLDKDQLLAKKAEAEQLMEMYRARRRSAATGESIGFDPQAENAPTFTQEEAAKLFNLPVSGEDVLQFIGETQRRNYSELAMELPTYALNTGMPLILDADDRPTTAVSEVGDVLPGQSIPRYCLAGLLQPWGVDARAVRLAGYWPVAGLDLDTIVKYDLPQPKTDEDFQEISSRFGGEVLPWMQAATKNRVRQYCIENNLYPIAAPPRSIGRNGVAKFSVLCMDADIVTQICARDNNKAGRDKVHYLQILFSNGDTHNRNVRNKEGNVVARTTVADYREMDYIALTTEEMSYVSELVGCGSFVSDGGGFYVSPYVSWTQVQDQVLMNEGTEIDEEEARRRARIRNHRNSLEFQFRATELKDKQIQWLAKGMLRPLTRKALEDGLRRYEQAHDEYLADLVSAEDKTDANDRFVGFKLAYGPAGEIIKQMLVCEVSTMLIIKGDQIKVNPEKASTGVAHVVGTYLKGKSADPVLPSQSLPADTSEEGFKLVWTKLVCSVLSKDHDVVSAGPHKPEQYRVAGNSQVGQFATNEVQGPIGRMINSQVERVAEMLLTPDGIAGLISMEERDRRLKLDDKTAYGEMPVRENMDDLDLVREALRSNVIQLTTRGVEFVAAGKLPTPGEVRMPEVVRTRLDSIVAARLKRILKTFGITYYGYHAFTVENEVSTLRALWGMESRYAGKTNYGLTTRDEFADYSEELTPRYPFLDHSAVVLPDVITRNISGDDDGDIIFGMAAHVVVGNRVVKAVMFGRYPMVDIPSFMILPAGTPTPFDARNEDEEANFTTMIEALKLELPEDADLWNGIAVPTSPYLKRVTADGAKSDIEKKPLKGPVKLETCLDTVKRKWDLNQTGSLTRHHERLAVVSACAHDAIKAGKFKYIGEEKAVEIWPEMWINAAEYYDEAKRSNAVLLELGLTGFKYDLEMYQRPAIHLGEDYCPFGFQQSPDVTAAIPLKYHAMLESMRTVLIRNHRDLRNVCVERLIANKRKVPVEGYGKEAKILNFVLVGLKHKGKLIGGATRKVVYNLNEIKTEINPYLVGLKNTLLEYFPNGKVSDEAKLEASRASAAFEMWRVFWREVLQNRARMIHAGGETEEAYAEAQAYVGHAAQVIRYKMQTVAAQMSDGALCLAVYQHLRRQAEIKSEREQTYGQRSTAEEEKIYNNAASIFALIEGRINAVFPDRRVDIKVSKKTRNVGAFTKGSDLPGMIGAELECDLVINDRDRITARFARPGVEGEYDFFVLQPGDGSDVGFVEIPLNANLSIVKTSARRVVIRY